MASAIIHICVANEVNKVIKRKNDDVLIGSIAPDISKHVGMTKKESHFLYDNTGIPNLNLFMSKYMNNLNNDFVLGYYIHLYTDYLWEKCFMPEFLNGDYIHKLDGSVEFVDLEKKRDYIYNDYTNLNIKLIDLYNLDLKIFYNEPPCFEDIIKEIPMDKIQLIIDKTGIVIENSKRNKEYIFDIRIVDKFIKFATGAIIEDLNNRCLN